MVGIEQVRSAKREIASLAKAVATMEVIDTPAIYDLEERLKGIAKKLGAALKKLTPAARAAAAGLAIFSPLLA